MILWLNCLVFLCKWLLKCACDACGIVSGFERFYGRMDAWMNEGKDVSELCEDARIEQIVGGKAAMTFAIKSFGLEIEF